MNESEFLKAVEKYATKILTDPQDTACYAYDASNLECNPSAVLFADSAENIAAILKAANRYKTAVTPRGAGTSVAGGAVPTAGGVILNLSKMDRILEIDEENLTATVQPGVVTYDLHQTVEKMGLFYPPDPGSVRMSTIGGNVAVNAGGPHCFKYGVTKDYVLGMEVVLPDGKIIRFGGKYIKDVSGLNLGSLFIGSEGILGIITEITLRLIPLPQTQYTALAVYKSLQAASDTVSAIVKNKIVPATMELMDQDTMKIIEQARHLDLPVHAAASLLIAVDGATSQVESEIGLIEKICKNNGATAVEIAKDVQQQERLWEGRRSANGAMSQSCKALIVEDACVPRNKLTAMIVKMKEIANTYHFSCPVMGHSGDGNVHPHLLLQELTAEEWQRADMAVDEILKAAIELGGTVTGEHGIGIHKRKYMKWQFSPDTLELMKTLKVTLDPNHILNPHILL